ncbi:hypothetical protein DSM117340_02312 [Lentibacter algarum]
MRINVNGGRETAFSLSLAPATKTLEFANLCRLFNRAIFGICYLDL